MLGSSSSGSNFISDRGDVAIKLTSSSGFEAADVETAVAPASGITTSPFTSVIDSPSSGWAGSDTAGASPLAMEPIDSL